MRLFPKTLVVLLALAFLIVFSLDANAADYYALSCPNYVVLSSPVDVTVQKTADGNPICDDTLQVKVTQPSGVVVGPLSANCIGSANVFSINSSQNGRYEIKALAGPQQSVVASCAFSAVYKSGSQVSDSNFFLTALVVLVAFLLLARARGKSRRRGQLAIEFFFALTLFVLLLPWLSYYAGSTKTDATAANALMQQRLLAKDLVKTINQACVTNTSITFEFPCVRVGETNLNYSINSSGSLIYVKGEAPFRQNVFENASCETLLISLSLECNEARGNAGLACVNVSQGGAPNVTSGNCKT